MLYFGVLKNSKTPMKIAMIGQKGIPAHSGGIERHVEELSAELVEQNHEVLAFCRDWYVWPLRNHRGVRAVKAPSIKTKHLDAISHTFFSILKAAKMDVDVFHIHGVGPALLTWLPKLLNPSARVIVTFHCIDRFHQKWNPIARFMLHLGEWFACRFADATITVSQTLNEYCLEKYDTKTVYIPNGVRLPEPESKTELLDRFELEPNNYLMMCARLVKHKGAHTLIDAWKRLKNEQPKLIGDTKLAIVGGSAFTDGYVKELEEASADAPSVVMTGQQSGGVLHTLFSHAYAIVHPSESEGLPIAVLEAMSYGKCVLSSDIPENMELTELHGRTFPVDDVGALKDGMAKLLKEPEAVKRTGERARTFVKRRFSWNDIAETTSALYETVCYLAQRSRATSK